MSSEDILAAPRKSQESGFLFLVQWAGLSGLGVGVEDFSTAIHIGIIPPTHEWVCVRKRVVFGLCSFIRRRFN